MIQFPGLSYLTDVEWNLIFQITCVISIFVILWNVKWSDQLDHLRHPDKVKTPLFVIRRTSKFVMALALCWIVIYAHERAWVAWPPFIVFLLAFDTLQITHVLVMRLDTDRIKRRELLAERSARRSGPAAIV